MRSYNMVSDLPCCLPSDCTIAWNVKNLHGDEEIVFFPTLLQWKYIPIQIVRIWLARALTACKSQIHSAWHYHSLWIWTRKTQWCELIYVTIVLPSFGTLRHLLFQFPLDFHPLYKRIYMFCFLCFPHRVKMTWPELWSWWAMLTWMLRLMTRSRTAQTTKTEVHPSSF